MAKAYFVSIQQTSEQKRILNPKDFKNNTIILYPDAFDAFKSKFSVFSKKEVLRLCNSSGSDMIFLINPIVFHTIDPISNKENNLYKIKEPITVYYCGHINTEHFLKHNKINFSNSLYSSIDQNYAARFKKDNKEIIKQNIKMVYDFTEKVPYKTVLKNGKRVDIYPYN